MGSGLVALSSFSRHDREASIETLVRLPNHIWLHAYKCFGQDALSDKISQEEPTTLAAFFLRVNK